LNPSNPHPSHVTQFHRQRVDWKSCQRDPDDAEGHALDEAGVRCADIRVPLDYSQPRGRTDVLPYASTANAARDMDVIRAAFGAPKLSFLGYSQGSYLGAQYMQRFPQRAGRSVLNACLDTGNLPAADMTCSE
jgi:pimeloyl-ACP methyl ester carboxylesterase